MFSHFRAVFRQQVLHAACVTLSISSASAALATPITPGQTLSSVPASLLSGLTLENNGSQAFSITYIRPFPQTGILNTTGTVNWWVYRKADNTLVFAYTVTDSATSDTVINHWSVRDYFDFATDVVQGVDLIAPFSTAANSATRSADGNSLTFYYDLGFTEICRAVYIQTDATSYDLAGRASLWMFPSAGSTTIGRLPRPVTDNTPPVVTITSPQSLGFTCNPATIVGSVTDSGGLDNYKVEYSASPNGPWTLISQSTTPVSNATLATWNTSAVAQGWYYLRVTATNTSNLQSVVSSLVFVDKQFDTVDLRSPGANQLLGGSVCFDGSVNDGQGGSFVNYRIDFAPLPAGAPFSPVNPATPLYTTAIVNDGLGSWNTASGSAAVADGSYRLRVTGTAACGNTRVVNRDVRIDNTRPVALISSPSSCGFVRGVVNITGTASDANISGWSLQYTGGNAHSWVTIATGTSNITNATLATWNTAGLAPCAYTLRLLVSDQSAINCGSTTNQAEYTTSVKVGCPADFNSSGGVSVQDIFDFLAEFFSPCP